MSRMLEFAAACSQLLNVATGGNRDQTFSARAHEGALLGRRRWIIARNIINGLFCWQADHCLACFDADEERTYADHIL